MIEEHIIEELSDMIYIADLASYELLFLNKAGYDLLGITDCASKKCYELIYNLDHPCEFCPNHLLKQETFYIKEVTNPYLNRYFITKHKLITQNNQPAHMCIAIDITALEMQKKQMEMELVTQQLISICLKTLHTTYDLNQTIQFILQRLCKLLKGTQAYLCQFNDTKAALKKAYHYVSQNQSADPIGELTSFKSKNTRDWQEPHIASFNKSQKATNQCLSLGATSPLERLDATTLKHWANLLITRSPLWINELSALETGSTFEYQFLKDLKVHHLLTVSLQFEENTLGFISIANGISPTPAITNLLRTIGYFALQTVDRFQTKCLLERLSYYDALTDLYNRNKYIVDLEKLSKHQPDTLGIAYIDINGLKLINDTYGHSYGDALIIQVTSYMRTIFNESAIYRVGGDEFIILCPNMTHSDFQNRLAKLKTRFMENETCKAAVGPLWTNCTVNIENLISKADHLMYEDKKNYYRNNIMPHKYNHISN